LNQCAVTKDKPFPSISTLYWELDLLFKDADEGDMSSVATNQPVDSDAVEMLALEKETEERPSKAQKREGHDDVGEARQA
jgi:hypothetical protein